MTGKEDVHLFFGKLKIKKLIFFILYNYKISKINVKKLLILGYTLEFRL